MNWSVITHTETCIVIPANKAVASDVTTAQTMQGYHFNFVQSFTKADKNPRAGDRVRNWSKHEPENRVYVFFHMNDKPSSQWAEDIAADKEKLEKEIQSADPENKQRLALLLKHEEALMMLEEVHESDQTEGWDALAQGKEDIEVLKDIYKGSNVHAPQDKTLQAAFGKEKESSVGEPSRHYRKYNNNG